MLTARKVLFWTHLSVGVVCGLVILSMSVSGALLAFAPQLLRYAERDQRLVDPPVDPSARLGAGALLAAVQKARPELEPSALLLESDPRAAALVMLGRGGVLYVHPRSGVPLGDGARGLRAGLRAVEDWHRWFAGEGRGRAAGKAVTGAANAGFLLLALSGPILWLPAQWSRQHVAAIVRPRLGLRGRARDFNWHNALGLWCAPVLLCLIASALLISYPALADLLYAGPARTRSAAPRDEARAPRLSAEAVDRLWARAAGQVGGWHALTLRVPQVPGPVMFSIQMRPGGGRSLLSLDPATADVVKWEPYESFSLGRQLRAQSRALHTGEILGAFGQALAALASLGAAVLVYTGLALSWRRLRASRTR